MGEHRLHARCRCRSAEVEHAEHASQAEHALGRPFAFPTSPRNFERDRPFVVEHLALELGLVFERRQVAGTATLRVRRVSPTATALTLDAVGFTLSAVEVEGARADFIYDGRALRVELGDLEEATVRVVYTCTPRRGLYFIEPDEHRPGLPRQAWTQCQEEDARHFFPSHDKPHVKMTTELSVVVPPGYTALSNGHLAAREPRADGVRFHWKMTEPHPSYLLTLVVGELEVLEDDGPAPLTYYVPPGRAVDARRTFAQTAEMMRFFGERFASPYPWNKYAQAVVSDFFFGGMENTTATTLYEHVLLDERAALDGTSDDLIAHELAHQWFGDFVTCRDWSEAWLNEGFATFCEHLFREHRLGVDEYEYGLKTDLGSYVAEARGRYRRPLVCPDYDAPLDLFDRHLYEKGGLVLHVLRRTLGDDAFFAGVAHYLRAHAKGLVETRDLQRALERVSGRSLGRAFEEHVHRPGHVELEVSLAWDDGMLLVTVKQGQAPTDGVPAIFHTPLVLDCATTSERGRPVVKRLEVELTQRNQVFALPSPRRPRFVVVDPDLRVLGEVSVRGPLDMLREQLAHAPTARGRWLAAASLAKIDDPPTRAALAARLHDDREFWGVRADCAAALGLSRSAEAFEALERALGASSPKVRRAVAEALGATRTAAAATLLAHVARSDASYFVSAEAARALGKTRQGAALDDLVELLDRPSWAEVVRAGAIDGLASLRDARALPHLRAKTRYGQAPRARRAAALALGRLSEARDDRELLEELLDDRDPLLRQDVARALQHMGDPRARAALRAREGIEDDVRVRRRLREVLRDLTGDRKAIAQEAEAELEKLRAHTHELETRLQKLEARLGPARPGKTRAAKPARPAKPAKPATPAKPARKTGSPRAK
ncbi:MAG TPA: M1 family aminopeptidase [Polyangiaceae bacterium]|nr:M1 family aminopeptidase [Polyangiaceae bacterium]